MGLFFNSQRQSPPVPQAAGSTRQIPIAPIDTDKRYDLYCALAGEERLYENVRFIGVRTFDPITEYSSGFVNGFLEIEAANGVRMLLPNFGIQLICEHGVEPVFTVLREWKDG